MANAPRPVDHVLAEVGDTIAGKTVVDVTNPLTPDYQLAVGFNTSAAEQGQAKSARANVVKAFNYLFAPHMSTGKLNDTTLTLFVAGDNETAKDHVRGLGRDIGFDPVDAELRQQVDRWASRPRFRGEAAAKLPAYR